MRNNYKLTIGYDGSRYYGWEHKEGRDTIQGKIVSVLGHLTDEEIHLIGAGRTDAGVHAEKMVANVHLDVELSPEEIRDYLNHYLPDDIVVHQVEIMPERFHARYNATGKTYRYTLFHGETKPVFDRKYVWTVENALDMDNMVAAANILTGQHDFAAFCKNPQKKKSTVRTVDQIKIEKENEYIRLTFHGTGFLHHMVRIMTGTIVEVGLGRMSIDQVSRAVSECDRNLAGPTAPAQGLCLMEIDYPAR